jgi:hypothetical protein
MKEQSTFELVSSVLALLHIDGRVDKEDSGVD